MAEQNRPRRSQPRGQDSRPGSGRPQRSGSQEGRRQGDGRKGAGGRPGADRRGQGGDRRPFRERDDRPRDEQQARYDGPPLPDEVTGRELDRSVTAQLKGLPEKLAARVARHLAAAGLLIDEDPRTAYEHTLAARARASRLAVVREACGEAAYAAGEYAEALS
jgi:hypothetical protein